MDRNNNKKDEKEEQPKSTHINRVQKIFNNISQLQTQLRTGNFFRRTSVSTTETSTTTDRNFSRTETTYRSLQTHSSINRNNSSNLLSKQPQPTPLTSSSLSKLKLNPSKKKPALLYIFNHVTFEGKKEERKGTHKDVETLKAVFKKYKVEIVKFEDPTYKDITNALSKISKKKYDNYSAVFFAILTHGDKNGILFSKNERYSIYDDFIFKILPIKSLASKPKIFMIEACRGVINPLIPPSTDSYASSDYKELLMFCSSTENYVSFITETGSTFIQELCKKIEEMGSSTPIDKIMKETIEVVKRRTGNAQIPVIEYNTLTAPYILGDHT